MGRALDTGNFCGALMLHRLMSQRANYTLFNTAVNTRFSVISTHEICAKQYRESTADAVDR